MMTVDLDERLRGELRELAARSPVLLPEEAVRADVSDRVRRRRLHRRAAAAGVVSAACIVCTAAFLLARDATVTTEAPSNQPATPDQRVVLTEVAARGEPGLGTAEVILTFDHPLPQSPITQIDDITTIDTPTGIGWTVQGPRTFHVCDDVHSFSVNDEADSVDILLPAAWFAPDEIQSFDRIDPLPAGPGEGRAGPSKIVVCGPFKGYVQVALWGSASRDPRDVNIRASSDRTRLLIDIG